MRTVVAELLSRSFWITALVMMALGLWLPGDWSFLRGLIPVFLGGILLFTALKVPLTQIAEQASRRNLLPLVLLSLIKLVLLGLAGGLVAHLIAPDWALGVVVVMVMPAGLSSPAMTDLYRGHVGFALIFTLLTSALCPLTIPFVVQLFDPGAGIEVSVLAGRAAYIAVLLVTPLALAQFIRRFAPDLVQRHYGRWSYGAVLSSCLLIFVSISANREAWADMPVTSFAIPLIATVAALTVALLAGMAVARWWRGPEGIAFGFCCLWMNNGLAVAFADRFYHGQAGVILPPVLMQLPIIIFVTILGRWWARRAEPKTA